jgi:hypothetical protein
MESLGRPWASPPNFQGSRALERGDDVTGGTGGGDTYERETDCG